MAKSQGKEAVFPGEEKEGKIKEERVHFSLVCLVPPGSSDDPGYIPYRACSCYLKKGSCGDFFADHSSRVPVLNQ